MAIKLFKFSYDLIIIDGYKLSEVDYVSRARNFIREATNNPNFELPKYFRCSVIYTPVYNLPPGIIYRWIIHYKKIINGIEDSGIIKDRIESFNFKRYTYNKRNIPLEYPETQLTDKLGFEEFHAVETDLAVLGYNPMKDMAYSFGGKKVRCQVTVRYSDDDFIAGDENPKRYLLNLDFGNRRSRRNNKNRRKYRNRYKNV